MSDASTYNRSIHDALEHLAAHLETGDGFTNHCDRVFISDGAFGLDWQIQRGIDWLFDRGLIDADDAQDALDDQNSPDYCGDLPDEIEALSNGLLLWEDGDLFEREEECSLWCEWEDGDYGLGLEVQGEHLELCITCGGPGTFLRRDFSGDYLVTYWGSDSDTIRATRAVTAVLDALAEMMGG